MHERALGISNQRAELEEIELHTKMIQARAEMDRVKQQAIINGLRLKNDLQDEQMRERSLKIKEENL